MKDKNWDVIITGASFAGLAAAHFIPDAEALLLERQNRLGKAQKSTCCTSLAWIERLGCQNSILQVLDYVAIHPGRGRGVRVRLPESFCTVDYKLFCETLAASLKNTEIKTGVRAIEINNGSVKTDQGNFSGKAVIDASGWPGVGNKGAWKNKWWRKKPAFGLEVETAYTGEMDSIHIFYGKRYTPHGYGWIFPIGKGSARIGIGGQFSGKPLKVLDRFLTELDVSRNGAKPHGGFLPVIKLGEAVRNKAFIVGDACNHVIPGSGEGIRAAFESGEICAGIVSRVLEGEITLDEGLSEYSESVCRSRAFYDNMRFIQDMAHFCPDFARSRLINSLLKVDEARAEAVLKRYLKGDFRASKAVIVKRVVKSLLK
ncbi:putative oxidoreductase/MT0587 [archaeon BMS3Abin16]|nr:putative oxidoreductase/MT0587 [archaeon BMS3Abin16]